jgi:hypothetical protein
MMINIIAAQVVFPHEPSLPPPSAPIRPFAGCHLGAGTRLAGGAALCQQTDAAPPDWTFPGTLLLEGPYGIHGLKSDWKTPHVLAFTNVGKAGYGYRIGTYTSDRGAFSPDFKWYAAVEKKNVCGFGCDSSDSNVQGIHVFNITGQKPREHYFVKRYLDYSTGRIEGDWVVPIWMNETALVFPADDIHGNLDNVRPEIINVFTGKKREWTRPFNPFDKRTSPDGKTSITYKDSEYQLVNNDDLRVIHTFPAPPFDFPASWNNIWSTNSRYFLGGTKIDDVTVQLNLYDRDTLQAEAITQVSTYDFYNSDRFKVVWSPDSRYFFLTSTKGFDTPSTQMLVDVVEKRIWDLCEFYFQPVWSPNSHAVADIDNYLDAYHTSVNIVDLENWQTYRLLAGSDHYRPIGWRTD